MTIDKSMSNFECSRRCVCVCVLLRLEGRSEGGGGRNGAVSELCQGAAIGCDARVAFMIVVSAQSVWLEVAVSSISCALYCV